MKKFILLLLAFVIAQISIAQDFQFFKTNQDIYFFSRDSATYDDIRPYAYQFDRIHANDTGYVLQSYNTQQYYAISDDTENIYNLNTSWIGDSVFIDNNGRTTIYNQYGRIFYFKPMEDTEPWIVFQDESGARIEGQYTGFSVEDSFPDFSDLIGTIKLTVYDSLGNIYTENSYNGFEIKISQNFGVMRLFRVNSFNGIYNPWSSSYDARPYYLVGVKTNEESLGFRYQLNPIVSRVDIGTEIHYSYRHYGYYHVIKKVLDKTINDSICSYLIQECIHKQNYVLDTIYSRVFEENYYFDLRPSEVRFLPDTVEQPFLRLLDFEENGEFQSKATFRFMIYLVDESFTFNGKELVEVKPDYSYSMGTTASYGFIDGLGKIMLYRGESKSGDQIEYYKTPTEEWGVPFEFTCPDYSGVETSKKPNFSIYPNPVDDILYIQAPQKTEIVSIYDLQGRLIRQYNLTRQTSLNISNLEEGFYVIQFQTKEGLMVQKKFRKL